MKIPALIVSGLLAFLNFIALGSLQPVAAKIQSHNVHACHTAVYVSIEMDNINDKAPLVTYSIGTQHGVLNLLRSRPQPVGLMQNTVFEYFAYFVNPVPESTRGQILINGGRATSFKAKGSCPVLGRIAGTAYLDNNQNGKRDANEPIFAAAWMKITGGGVWFVCGGVSADATFGVTVTPGKYIVMPVAPAGYRTTTPKILVDVLDLGYIVWDTNIGFVKDAKAVPDACDQYNPPRP